MAETFTMPDFLLGADPESIQAGMMEDLPADIDDMPGGFPWDFTMPSARIISEFTQNRLVRVLQVMFPQFAWGKWLDMHGARANVTRRAAVAAAGTLLVTGRIGTSIPAGTVFCTPAIDGSESILFTTDEDALITMGEIEIPITAMEAGTAGNVMAGAVTLAFRPITGIISISNPEPVTGGADEEDDETYRERILETYRAEGGYTGCPADYVRWAKEVPGVGHAVCIPEWDGPGTVKLVIMDMEGTAASAPVLAAVLDHIMGTEEEPLARLAPVGASLTVSAPVPLAVVVSFEADLEEGFTLEAVKSAVKENLDALCFTAMENGSLHYADCFSAVNSTEGMHDCRNVTVNGGTSNISVSATQYLAVEIGTVTEY